MLSRVPIIPVLTLVVVVTTLTCCRDADRQQAKEPFDFSRDREAMVTRQIQDRGIADERVLAAMRKVERHRFVPEKYQTKAYKDYPLPIGENQTISQPYIVGLLDLDGTEKVLEIGTGSGYQAAVLAELAAEVYTIEIVEPLADRSEALLCELGYKNITVRCGDGFAGWPELAPFDAIIVTCAPPKIPQPLIDQLGPVSSGRPTGDTGGKYLSGINTAGKKGERTRHYSHRPGSVCPHDRQRHPQRPQLT
jgi:protein-L-isoaspartate(D-aspartate) O-methyltransferase